MILNNITSHKNIMCINADHILFSKLYLKNQKGYEIIKNNFGNNFVNKKEVKRDALFNYLFNNRDKLNLLEEIIWPILANELEKIITQCQEKIIICELGIYQKAIKYFGKLFNEVIYLDISENVQLDRLVNFRNMTSNKAKKTLKLLNIKKTYNPWLYINTTNLSKGEVVNIIKNFLEIN